MSEITGITPQIKDKNRCNIYVDGRFYCGLTLEAAVKNRLKVGKIVDEAELSAIQLESEKNAALDKALSFISLSQKSERQVKDYLKGKGYLEDTVAYVLEKMQGYGFIDDGAYAVAYAASAAKKKGSRLIKAELKQKGISESDIAALEIGDETDTAAAVLAKYLRGKPVDRPTLSKAFRYLLSKGFPYETARDALKKFGEADDEDFTF